VARERIQQQVVTLESQRVAVLKQPREKSLRIFTSPTGWTTEGELKASMAEIVKKGTAVGYTIHQGDYEMYVPGSEKRFSRTVSRRRSRSSSRR
jgi:hypothetical protein